MVCEGKNVLTWMVSFHGRSNHTKSLWFELSINNTIALSKLTTNQNTAFACIFLFISEMCFVLLETEMSIYRLA